MCKTLFGPNKELDSTNIINRNAIYLYKYFFASLEGRGQILKEHRAQGRAFCAPQVVCYPYGYLHVLVSKRQASCQKYNRATGCNVLPRVYRARRFK